MVLKLGLTLIILSTFGIGYMFGENVGYEYIWIYIIYVVNYLIGILLISKSLELKNGVSRDVDTKIDFSKSGVKEILEDDKISHFNANKTKTKQRNSKQFKSSLIHSKLN